MPEVCKKCNKQISRTAARIKCIGCLSIYHTACASADPEEIVNLEEWSCDECNVEPSLRDVMKQLNLIFLGQKNTTESIELCHKKIEDVEKLLKTQDEYLSDCLKRLEAAETNCSVIIKENDALKQRMNELEQYSRRNCLEIQGVPEMQNENTLSVIRAVSGAIGFSVEEGMIDACHRIGKSSKPLDSSYPRIIIIKFVRRVDKEEFMKLKKLKKNLCASALGSIFTCMASSKSIIYVNESLTASNRALFMKCKKHKNANNIKYLWINSASKIFMRMNDNSKVFEIKSENDFNDVY